MNIRTFPHFSQVRARATDLKLAASEGISLLEGRDVHIHFPAGAVPKDGPSAGVTLVTALVSLFSQQRMRADTAMTGEMTLRGLVLPVGGVKDKVFVTPCLSYPFILISKGGNSYNVLVFFYFLSYLFFFHFI